MANPPSECLLLGHVDCRLLHPFFLVNQHAYCPGLFNIAGEQTGQVAPADETADDSKDPEITLGNEANPTVASESLPLDGSLDKVPPTEDNPSGEIPFFLVCLLDCPFLTNNLFFYFSSDSLPGKSLQFSKH